MTDVADRAAAREADFLADALAEQRRRAGPAGLTPMDSARECADCDEPIPEARRQAVPGCKRCAECAAIDEQRRAQGPRRR